jgi:hypothetical protein
MKFISISLLFVATLFSVTCSKNQGTVDKGNQHTEIINGITHIYNMSIPAKGIIIPELELKSEIGSDMINSGTNAFFNEAAYDNNHNLFLLDSRASKIYKFNGERKYEKSFLQKGEGPAEIRKPVLTFKVYGNCVWASYVTEFCRFDTNGNFLEKKCFKQQYGLLEHVDEKRFITSLNAYTEGKKSGSICVLMDTQENSLAELFEKKDPNIGYSVIRCQDKNFEFVSATSPRLCYVYNPQNKLAYCYYNFDYSIWLMGLDGKAQKVIHKVHKPVEISDSEIERILSGFKRMGWPQHYLDAYKKNPPEKYFPTIRNLYLLPKNYFGIIRSLNYDQDEFDIFDPEGRFVYILKAPKQIPNLWGIYFFDDGLGVIIHDSERDIYREYKVKNLPQIFK